jgi:heme-degrading monooxygenase HmoA
MVVVLFRNTARQNSPATDYDELGVHLRGIASKMPGFVSLDVFSNTKETLIMAKFETDEHVRAWREHVEHQAAQGRRDEFYDRYTVEVCEVTRAYAWERDGTT